jgi:hypothetical protein
MRRLDAGFAVIGDTQFLPGYCVLLVDELGVQRLSDLPRGKRMAFLSDMERLGEAVERACRRLDPAFRRVNLEILGTRAGRAAWRPVPPQRAGQATACRSQLRSSTIRPVPPQRLQMKAKHRPCVRPAVLVRMEQGHQHCQGVDGRKAADHRTEEPRSRRNGGSHGNRHD